MEIAITRAFAFSSRPVSLIPPHHQTGKLSCLKTRRLSTGFPARQNIASISSMLHPPKRRTRSILNQWTCRENSNNVSDRRVTLLICRSALDMKPIADRTIDIWFPHRSDDDAIRSREPRIDQSTPQKARLLVNWPSNSSIS
jgi:hypothetical protein